MRGQSHPRPAVVAALLCATLAVPAAASETSTRLDAVVDAIVANERQLAVTLQGYRPLVETYIQTMKPDSVSGAVPVTDHYFLGRLGLGESPAVTAGEDDQGRKKSKHGKKDKRSSKDRSLELFDDFHSATFDPESFAKMLVLDREGFDHEHYEFRFVRAEFLGEVRTLVFDVWPVEGQGLKRLRTARFTGRIWVEDRDYNIVRYNGVYASAMVRDFQFDSWRLEMEPGLWLPAYVYTEEPEPRFKRQQLKHKGQTRIWGYEIDAKNVEDEFTQVLIDAPETRDASERPGRISPIESARAWRREAEDNVVRRLERIGLLAPDGEVDEVLRTVVMNLEITNGLDIQPAVRCRVLLTTPLESFAIGHTIVVSRGLIDVLPDEASLAMVLAHELGHVLSGHELDTRFAFGNQVLVGDRQAMDFLFERDPQEEREADRHAVELLRTSPYAEDLGTAGLFLRALTAHASELPSLIRPHFGNRMTEDGDLIRMQEIVASAPELDPASLEQIAALPLGGRVSLDPFTARVSLMQASGVALLSPSEKMPFQVTPLMPYMARHGSHPGAVGGQPPLTEPAERAAEPDEVVAERAARSPR